MKRRSQKELSEEWTLIATDYVGSRMVFFFQSVMFGDQQQMRISVTRTMQNPEGTAWEILDETVK